MIVLCYLIVLAISVAFCRPNLLYIVFIFVYFLIICLYLFLYVATMFIC